MGERERENAREKEGERSVCEPSHIHFSFEFYHTEKNFIGHPNILPENLLTEYC